MKLGNLFSLGKALFGGDHRSKNIVADVDSNAVSIFVDILVELKRTPLLLSRVRNTITSQNEQ